jgi:hypothetical protein
MMREIASVAVTSVERIRPELERLPDWYAPATTVV